MKFKKFFSAVFAVGFFCVTLLGGFNKVSAEEVYEAPPVSYTAPISLYWLYQSGVPEAAEYLEKIADDVNATEYAEYFKLKDLENVNAAYAEIRYSSSNDFIKRNGYKNILDIACGVSPHGILAARNGLNYVGVELPATVKIIEGYAPLFLKDNEKKFVSYAAADVTDTEEMKNAASKLNGKICIIEEGLAMYLSREQQKALLQNVREILKEHGGAYITLDFVVKDFFTDIGKELYDKKKAEELYKKSAGIYEEKGEVSFEDTLFDNQKDAIEFIKAQGLNVEIVPLFLNVPELNVYKELDKKQIKNLKKFAKKKYLWVMTVK